MNRIAPRPPPMRHGKPTRIQPAFYQPRASNRVPLRCCMCECVSRWPLRAGPKTTTQKADENALPNQQPPTPPHAAWSAVLCPAESQHTIPPSRPHRIQSPTCSVISPSQPNARSPRPPPPPPSHTGLESQAPSSSAVARRPHQAETRGDAVPSSSYPKSAGSLKLSSCTYRGQRAPAACRARTVDSEASSVHPTHNERARR